MCRHSGPDSDNGHRKKMAKMGTNYPSNNNNNNNCKAAADNNNNNNKKICTVTLYEDLCMCPQHSSLLSLSVSLSLLKTFSLSHYSVCFVLCSAATSSAARRALCTAFYALPATPPSTSAFPTAFRSCFNWESRLSQICIKRKMKSDTKFRR